MNNDDIALKVAEINARSNFRVAVVAGLFGGLLGAIGSGLVGWFEFSSKDKELNLELAQISLQLLSGDYDPEGERNPIPARRFAIQTLVEGTGVRLSQEDIELWATNGATPGQLGVQPSRQIDRSSTEYLSAGLDFDTETTGGFRLIEGDPNFGDFTCIQDEENEVWCGEYWSFTQKGYCVLTPEPRISCGSHVDRTFNPETGEVVLTPRAQ